ncbi:MAG: DUF3570 domain-containing protein [Gammaproteobacteria bacterium]
MQLKRKPKKIKSALALATTTMLVSTTGIVNAETPDKTWQVDSAILYYSETDRVTAIEPVVSIRKQIDEDEFIGMRLVFDSLTGSSPNGATKQPLPQSFSRVSGSAVYTTPANQTPTDPNFRESRAALSLDWEKPMSETSKGIYSFNFSKEIDYTSVGLAATFSWDTNQRLRTWTAGASYNFETIDPLGGVTKPYSEVLTTPAGKKETIGDTENKNVADILFGLTQIISRRTLMQFNINFGMDDGYLTDPYKLLSVYDANGDLAPGTTPNNYLYLYEKRPDSRTRQALFWKTVHSFGQDVVNVSYRYYWDDWGISSHTIDGRYRFEMGGGHYIEPHLRYYLQDKADFYNYNLVLNNTPTYASADYRLADMSTTTFGFKYGVEITNTTEFNIRIEQMTQQSESGDAPFDDVEAIIFQIGYSTVF